MTALEPQPWDAGAVAAILPELAAACPDIDWAQPFGAWPRETMVEFLLVAMRLIRKAMIARDISESGITRKSSTSAIARQANAGGGRTTDDSGRMGRSDRDLAMAQPQSRQPFARTDQRRHQRRDRARGRDKGRATATLPRRQHRRRGMPAQGSI